MTSEEEQVPRRWVGGHGITKFSLLGGVVVFVVFGIVDYLFVSSATYPLRTRDDTGVALAVPGVILIASYCALSHCRMWARVLLSVVTTVLAMLVGILLILAFGIPLHRLFGGW